MLQVFDNITRLAGIYSKLWSSGCILFKVWSADIFCSEEAKIGIRVTFGAGETVKKFEGKTDEGDISFWTSRLSHFMEERLQEWRKYIEKKRHDFSEMNYYTMDQIVILQKELATPDIGKGPSTLIYPLLSFVKEGCTKKDVDHAKRIVQSKLDEEKMREKLKEIKSKKKKETDEDKQKQTFIDKLVKSGISRKLAMAALLHGIDPRKYSAGN